MRVGRISVNSNSLDGGPSLPVGAERKSPVIRVGLRLHGSQCTRSCGKRNVELVMRGISGANGMSTRKSRKTSPQRLKPRPTNRSPFPQAVKRALTKAKKQVLRYFRDDKVASGAQPRMAVPLFRQSIKLCPDARQHQKRRMATRKRAKVELPVA